jgi:O-antigen/teichoic acid export membrane protein
MQLSKLITKLFDSDFIKKIIETYLTQILSLAINFLSMILFSRLLGPEPRGILAAAMTLIAMGVQFGNMGLHASNAYYVAADRTLLSVIIGNTCIISLVLGSLISTFIYVLSLINPSFIPINGTILLWASFLIPVALANLLFQNILLGIQEVRTYNKVEVFVKFFAFFSILILLLIGIRSIPWTLSVHFLVSSFSIYYIWSKIRPLVNGKAAFSFPFFKKSIAYGFRAYLGAFFSFLVIRIDLLMVKHYLGFEETGYYSVASNIADMIIMFPALIGTLLFPKIVAISDPFEKFKIVKKTAFGVFLLMLVLCTGCAFTAKPIISTLLGPKFLPAASALLWLLPGLVSLSVNIVFMNYLASLGFPLIAILSPFFAASLNILLNTKLIPELGIIGASFASSICYSLMLATSLIYLSFRNRLEVTRTIS